VDRGEELKRLQERAAEVRTMLAELEATGETQISLTRRARANGPGDRVEQLV
jgi:hypothetical protein